MTIIPKVQLNLPFRFEAIEVTRPELVGKDITFLNLENNHNSLSYSRTCFQLLSNLPFEPEVKEVSWWVNINSKQIKRGRGKMFHDLVVEWGAKKKKEEENQDTIY